MQTYMGSEQENLSFLLDQAIRDGEVRIRRDDGAVFVLRPETTPRSALDVAGINLSVTTQEIIDIVREGRKR